MDACTSLLESERFDEAAVRCGEVFEATGEPAAGVASARAHSELGEADQVLAWNKRLEGSSGESEMLALASRVFWQRRELAQAREASLREHALRREAGDYSGAAKAAYRLFYYSWSGDGGNRYREALKFAGSSYEDAATAKDRTAEGKALQALATVLYEVGDFERAGRLVDEAEERFGAEDPMARARLQVYRGLIQLNSGRPALARDDFNRALESAADDGDTYFFRATHLNAVKANLALGDLEAAERSLKAAWEHAESSSTSSALLYYRARVEHARGRSHTASETARAALADSPSPSWVRDLQYQLGVSEEAQGNLEAAEHAYEAAAGVVEEMRRSVGVDDLRAHLLDVRRRPFEALFRLQATAGRPAEALATSERARARTFLDVLANTTAADEVSRPPDTSTDSFVEAGARLRALEAFLPAMRESATASLPDIVPAIAGLGRRLAFVYFETEDAVWLQRVFREGISTSKLSTGAGALDRMVSRLLAKPGDRSAAESLYRAIFPEGALPAAGSRIVLVVDGALARLPFGALISKGRFLIEDYELSYAPSLTALVSIEENPQAEGGRPVVMADPDGDLAAARREAADVASRLGVEPLLGSAMTVAEVLAAREAEVLHLATHAGLGAGGSWLAVSGEKLSAESVLEGRVGPRVVVLAGCATAARPGRVMWGSLGTAFLAAGSQAVVASLWSVEDEATRGFVSRFYEYGGAETPSLALARAQRAAIRAGEPVGDWAPFVLLGSDREWHQTRKGD